MVQRLMSYFKDKKSGLQRMFAWVLVVGATAGLVACTTQAIERVNMLKYPEVAPACNLNPVVTCSSVLGHPLASVLGFPNAFIGMIVFAGLLMGGLALLAGGDKLQRWFWYIVYGFAVVLLGFAVWFFAVSLYVIGAICLYCIVCWAVSVPTITFSTAWLSQKGWLKLPFGRWLAKQSNASLWGIVFATYIVMVLLVFIRFREFFFG